MEKNELLLKEGGFVKISVEISLKNVGLCRGIISISVKDCSDFEIEVICKGIGSPIFITSSYIPERHFGQLLSTERYVYDIEFVNYGKIDYQLLCTRIGDPKHVKMGPEENNKQAIITFQPNYFILSPEKQNVVQIHVLSTKEQHFEEVVFIWARTKLAHLELVKSFTLKASFVDPTLEFSTLSLSFNKFIGVNEGECKEHLKDIVSVKNILEIPLEITLIMGQNFFVDFNDKLLDSIQLKLPSNKIVNVLVRFVPPEQCKRMLKFEGNILIKYLGHSKTDKIELCAEVFYPTIKFCPEEVDFKCLPLNFVSNRTIVMQNISPLTVYFNWKLPESFSMMKLLSEEVKSSSSDSFVDGIECKCFVNESSFQEESNNEISNEKEIVNSTEEFLKLSKKTLENVFEKYSSPDYDSDLLCNLKELRTDFQHVQLGPTFGVLEPLECSLIQISMQFKESSAIEIKAICDIFGGEEESLEIIGKAAEISYFLSENRIEFGRKLFCVPFSREIKLTNSGFGEFHFKIEYGTAEEKSWPSWLKITPKTGSLQANESISIDIKYFAGLPKEINETFTLKVYEFKEKRIRIN